MGRKALPNWAVWYWDGTAFDLVWFDLTLTEARNMTEWRNERAEAAGSPHRYVLASGDADPLPPEL